MNLFLTTFVVFHFSTTFAIPNSTTVPVPLTTAPGASNPTSTATGGPVAEDPATGAALIVAERYCDYLKTLQPRMSRCLQRVNELNPQVWQGLELRVLSRQGSSPRGAIAEQRNVDRRFLSEVHDVAQKVSTTIREQLSVGSETSNALLAVRAAVAEETPAKAWIAARKVITIADIVRREASSMQSLWQRLNTLASDVVPDFVPAVVSTESRTYCLLTDTVQAGWQDAGYDPDLDLSDMSSGWADRYMSAIIDRMDDAFGSSRR